MKSFKITLIALFIVSSFAACKKDKTDPVVAPITIEGTWTGSYVPSDSNLFPTDFICNIITANKTFQIQDPTDPAKVKYTGSWTLEGNILRFNYPISANTILYFQGTFDSKLGKIVGTYATDDSSASGTGNFSMSKNNK
jgi:hypothetical protein